MPKKDVEETEAKEDSEETDDKKNETPEERFLRLATARTNKAVKMIEGIGKLKGGGYKHDKRPERLAKIKTAIMDALNKAIPDEAAMPGSEDAPKFKLE